MIQDERYRSLWRASTESVEALGHVDTDQSEEEEEEELQQDYDESFDDAGGLFGDENGGLDPGSEKQSEDKALQ